MNCGLLSRSINLRSRMCGCISFLCRMAFFVFHLVIGITLNSSWSDLPLSGPRHTLKNSRLSHTVYFYLTGRDFSVCRVREYTKSNLRINVQRRGSRSIQCLCGHCSPCCPLVTLLPTSCTPLVGLRFL